MPEAPVDGPSWAVSSRRRLASLIAGGALTGGVWSTGLSVLARGRHPQVFVLGNDGWQVLLIEHGTSRILMLIGTFEESPDREIDLLCGLLRQHIDVVVGSGEALGSLSSTFRNRRSVRTIVQLDGSEAIASSPAFVPLAEPVQLRAGVLGVRLDPLSEGRWKTGSPGVSHWIAHLTAGDLIVAIGPSLDVIANHGRAHSTLAIAPVGDIARVWSVIPGITIASNTRDSLATLGAGLSSRVQTRLVRTFRRDIAAFRLKDNRIELPDWTREA